MTKNRLFPSPRERRECVVCGAITGYRHLQVKPGESTMLGLYVTIYRRTVKGRQLAASGKVNVCEDCLLKVAAEGGTYRIGGRRLADAILTAVAKRAATMSEEDPRRSAQSPKEPAA